MPNSGDPFALFAQRRGVELADLRDHRLLVVADDQPDQHLHEVRRDGFERARAQVRRAPRRVAIEDLERAHRRAVGFLEPVGILQRCARRELVEHLRLDLALGPELLEDRVGALVVVGADQLERVEPVGELVEQQVLGPAELAVARRSIVPGTAGRGGRAGVVAVGHGRTVPGHATGVRYPGAR